MNTESLVLMMAYVVGEVHAVPLGVLANAGTSELCHFVGQSRPKKKVRRSMSSNGVANQLGQPHPPDLSLTQGAASCFFFCMELRKGARVAGRSVSLRI